MSKIVPVNIEEFSVSLERLIGESDEWQVSDLFDEQGQLTAEGLQKIVNCSVEVLNSLSE